MRRRRLHGDGRLTDPTGEEAAKPLPPLRRDIEIVPVRQDGQNLFLLHDDEGLGADGVAVPESALLILSCLDGRRGAAEVRSEVLKRTGAALGEGEIAAFATELAAAGLLETEELRERRLELWREFAKNPVRKARYAGKIYPSDRLELAKFLGAYLHDGAKGPGKPLAESPSATSPVGLVAPHIDYSRGGPAYAWAYQALSESQPPDLVVALGVAHSSPDSPWTAARKAYDTPYGPIAPSDDLYEALASSLWYDPQDDVWAHRQEHSLELAAVWLKFLWREKTPPWLPILCSSFARFAPDRPPSGIDTIEKALQDTGRAFAKIAARKRVLILASVDLAHVGPRFGDDMPLGAETEKKIEDADHSSLEHALRLDADAFYLSVVADGHWRKVCGLSALYSGLRWMKILGAKETGNRLLSYGQAPDPMGGIVSFASAIFPS
jgi:AmmeMemoRadiSam system protein B